ncbi:hypothetical protein NQ318_018128 [Aromia moschata]|uniref:DUF4817 domain-containing protein n=1 Tax=Aromia moschata TaxID=1265417 RepID=A0AAV8ZDX5_9CUCU|nr:hypothetical protein NQ318_018128 [Aromia moschata]
MSEVSYNLTTVVYDCTEKAAKSNLVCMLYSEFETRCYFKLVKISYLTESQKIEILMMIGYGDRARTQCEVVRLFRETHPDLPPLNQGTISKIEAQYREMGHVRKVPSKRQAVVDDATKLNLLLALEENPITPARQLACDSNLNHKTVLKIIKYEKKRPYERAVQELLEDDPDRRVEFCDLLMTCIDQNQLSLEWIVFSDEATFTLNGHTSTNIGLGIVH